MGVRMSGTQKGIILGQPFSPLNLGSALTFWLDSSDASSITSSAGAVSQWDDKSGLARNATQATGANQPITGATTLNGRNVLDFNGSSQYMLTGTSQFVNATDGTVTGFAVCVPSSVSGLRPILDLDNEGAVRLPQLIGTNGTAFSLTRVAGGIFTDTTGTAAVSTPYVVTGIQRTASIEIYANGVSNGATATTGSNGTTTNFTQIGVHAAGTFVYFQGSIAEVILCSSVLSNADLNSTGNYLATKWGISWTTI